MLRLDIVIEKSYNELSKTCLVAKPFAGDDRDLIADTLVGLEVECEFGIVPFDDDLGGFLDCLISCACEQTYPIPLRMKAA